MLAPRLLDLAVIGEPALHYRRAIEHAGMLSVTFSMNKRHCWLASIPVADLTM